MEIDKEAAARAQLTGLLELMDESKVTFAGNGSDNFSLIGLDKLDNGKANVIVKYARKYKDLILHLMRAHDEDMGEYHGLSRIKANTELSSMVDLSIDQNGLTVTGKIKIINELKHYIAASDNDLSRTQNIQYLAERIGVNELCIQREVNNLYDKGLAKVSAPSSKKGMANLAKLAKEVLHRARKEKGLVKVSAPKENTYDIDVGAVSYSLSEQVAIIDSFINKQIDQTWVGSPSQLLNNLEEVSYYCEKEGKIFTEMAFAPNASSMSKKLRKLSNILKEAGISIEFDFRSSMGTRQIRITKNFIVTFDELMSFVKKHGIFLGHDGKTVTAEYNSNPSNASIEELLSNSLRVHKEELLEWLQSQTFKPIPWSDHIEDETRKQIEEKPKQLEEKPKGIEEIKSPGFCGAPQEFVITHGKLPGMNEMIDAAKKTIRRKARSHSILTMYSIMKKKWINLVSDAVLEAKIQPVDKFFLQLIWTEPSKKRDPDNIAAFIKFILDGMQKAGVIKNDGWSEVQGWTNGFQVGEARSVKVRIYTANG